MTDTKKVIRMLNNTLRHCHNLYNHVTSEEQTWLAEINQGAKEALELLKEQPEQKHGHWIERDEYYECSVCKEPWVLIDGTPLENGMYFCPKCGARMESEVKQE